MALWLDYWSKVFSVWFDRFIWLLICWFVHLIFDLLIDGLIWLLAVDWYDYWSVDWLLCLLICWLIKYWFIDLTNDLLMNLTIDLLMDLTIYLLMNLTINLLILTGPWLWRTTPFMLVVVSTCWTTMCTWWGSGRRWRAWPAWWRTSYIITSSAASSVCPTDWAGL